MQPEIKDKLIKWLVGLLSTGLSGMLAPAGGVLLAPSEFNFGDGIYKLFALFLIGFIAACVNYFQKSPLYNALYD